MFTLLHSCNYISNEEATFILYIHIYFRYVARHNTTFKMSDVRELFLDARATVNADLWQRMTNHVITEIEDRFWATDIAAEEVRNSNKLFHKNNTWLKI